MDQTILITGLIVMLARILDVALGTMRTIVIVQGRMITAFFLGFLEITIWVTVVGTVITQIKESPILVIFYSLGFALGNVVGIVAEKKVALGPIILKVFVTEEYKEKVLEVFRQLFVGVTTFSGMGVRGPVTEIYAICRRKDLKLILPPLLKINPHLFYVTEQARDVSRLLRPIQTPLTGWRAILKKK